MPRNTRKQQANKRTKKLGDTRKIYRISDDKDDIPLTVIQNNIEIEDPNSYNSLCKPISEQCEICENISKNRYFSLIHNIKHIIIPLLNQTVYQCDICLYYFTSIEERAQHQYKKHSLIDLVAKTDLVKRSFNNPNDHSYESDFITIVKNIKNEENETVKGKNEFKTENLALREFKTENLASKEFKTVNLALREVKTENLASWREDPVSSTKLNNGSLKSRLMFEEDVLLSNCDEILNDLTESCRVNVELLPPIWDFNCYEKSIHYDQLLSPGVYRCRKCRKMFPNRYEMIIHETKHISIKNSQVVFCNICNQYILSDDTKLKHHKLESHNNKLVDSQKDYIDHTRMPDSGNIEKQNGVEHSLRVVTMKLCNVCYSFCKKNANVSYYIVEELCQIGNRFKCDHCGNIFFAIMLVKRESKCNNAFTRKAYTKKKLKSLSNKERLKIITQRFKNLKKIYFLVLFSLSVHICHYPSSSGCCEIHIFQRECLLEKEHRKRNNI